MATATPGPLDHLPRPLSERGRVPLYRRRRFGAVLLAGMIAAVGVAVATSLSSGPLTPVGDVRGRWAARPRRAPARPWPRSRRPPRRARRRVAAATPTPAPTAPPPETLTGYRWPLPHGRLTLPFGPTPWGSRVVDGEPFHDGIDLATFCGDRIVAAHDGDGPGRRAQGRPRHRLGRRPEPYFTRLDKKHLWTTLPIVVVIDDGNGYRSIYAHFGKVVVKQGQTVKAGQLLGYEGRTGRASGCHLHYGLFSPAEVASSASTRRSSSG